MPKYLMAKDRRSLKRRLCESQNWRCCYCGIAVSDDKAAIGKWHQATFDHVIPMAQIRRDSPFNPYKDRWYHRNHYDKRYWNYEALVIACYSCNSKRKNTDAYAFYCGELWKPENKLRLKLWHMKKQFEYHAEIGLLRAMGKFCKCEELHA